MLITKQTVAQKLAAYLHHDISVGQLVDWAENAIMDGDFEERELPVLRDSVSRIGVADVRSFGLTWEDCEQLLKRLGYTARVDIAAT